MKIAEQDQKVAEAFNSMLRTDYISLNDIDKLNLLSNYYVDYFGYLNQILAESDQLIVGRRGTGKTTLLYRAFVECMRSWGISYPRNIIKPRTLGIYIDLSKCHSLESIDNFDRFEHMFVTELCESINEQLYRFWPSLSQQPNLLMRIFKAADREKIQDVQDELDKFARLLQKGIPRLIIPKEQAIEEATKRKSKQKIGIGSQLSPALPEIAAEFSQDNETEIALKSTSRSETKYRLAVIDVLRILQSLRQKANISAIYVFVDEFSSLSSELQGRFTTLLRKMLGTHAGVFIKLCAITDNYTLGSSIILQRDLFEVSLDLDSFVERNQGLNEAMRGLQEHAEKIVNSRLKAYSCPTPEQLFNEPKKVWQELSREAMGVPRTLGIILQQAWNRRRANGGKIRKSDIDYGIGYASKAYLDQMSGASKNDIAIPGHVSDLWHALLDRASQERQKGKSGSHFMVLIKYEEALKYLNMFFLVHLLTKGRTTKKDSASRSLYCFDYGVCIENNLEFTTDKNIIRQQRFAYDEVIAPFYEQYYARTSEPTYQCLKCRRTYRESEIQVAGETLKFCPKDKEDLRLIPSAICTDRFTEEETKIIGAIRSASKSHRLVARKIADDVGCYVQKVAKFGEKLDKEELIEREKDKSLNKYIYFEE